MTDAQLPAGVHLDSEAVRRFESRLLQALDELRDRFGPVFTVHKDGRPPRVYVADAAAIRALFSLQRDSFTSTGSSLFKPLVGADSLTFLNGPPHRRVRELLSPALRGERLRSYAPGIRRTTKAVLGRASQENPLPALELASRMALAVTLCVLLGEQARLDAVAGAFLGAVEALDPSHLKDRPDGAPGASGDAACTFLHATIRQEIASAPRAPSVLSHLLQHTDLDDAAICNHLVTLLVGGYESLSATIAWALYWITANPEVNRRILEETGGTRSPYLDAVCKETMRLSSVVPTGLTRHAITDVRAPAHHIPAGTELVACLHLLHHDPRAFPQPEVFRPERFLTTPHGSSHYLPFGLGTRRCVGASLAALELPLMLAELLAWPGMSVAIGGPVHPRGRTTSVIPSGDLTVTLPSRQPDPPC